jgi:hypothetical protein
LVAAFISSFFAAHAADALFVMLAYGPHAFFVEGLRVTDWKHGILSTGQELPALKDVLRIAMFVVLMLTFIACAEWIAGLLTALRRRCAPWVSVLLRFMA